MLLFALNLSRITLHYITLRIFQIKTFKLLIESDKAHATQM